MAIRCPHCQSQVPFKPKVSAGYIFTSRGTIVLGAVNESNSMASASGSPMTAWSQLIGTDYTIAECAECHREFVTDSKSKTTVLPLASVSSPPEIPENIRRMVVEAKSAHAVAADTAALLAARTALIRLQRHENCSKINDLVEKGIITKFLANQANEVRLWANVTGHEEVADNVLVPEDVEQLLQYMDVLFDTIYVQPAKLKALQSKRGNATKAGSG